MKRGTFWAFTAVFWAAVLYIFAGTWSLDLAPIMPDCAVNAPRHWGVAFFSNWLTSGKFVPDDLLVFLGGPYVWNELRYAVALFAAAVALAWFLKGRGISSLAAYGAGLFLAFSSYWCTLYSAGHLGWFRWMTYGVFAFGLIDRALAQNKPRYWLLLGACLAWGSFYQPDLWLLFTVFTAIYFVYRLVCERKSFLKGAALALITFILVGLPSFYQALTHDLKGREEQIAASSASAQAGDPEARWVFVTNWSLPPEDTLEFIVPRIHGDTSCPLTLAINGATKGTRPYTGRLGRPINAPSGNYRQHALYVGAITCLLALLAVGVACGGKRLKALTPARRDILFFAVCAFVFWLFALGRFCEPVYRLIYALPFGNYLRAPVKWHHLTEFALVVLSGYGLEALARLLARTSLSRTLQTALLAALIVVGTVDLARIDALYCAPRKADFDLQFIDAQSLQRPDVQAQLRRAKIHVKGYYGSAALLEIPGQRQDGDTSIPRAQPLVLVLALISLLTDFAILYWCVRDAILARKARQ